MSIITRMDFLNRFYKKLILGTHHDQYGIIPSPHKILGYGSLVHVGYRYWLFITTGHMFTYQPYEMSFVMGHLLLSCSSFLFPVHSYRNFHNQIIWRELQLHNICFASRSCCVMIYHLTWTGTGAVTLWSKCMLALIVLSHHILADIASIYYAAGNTMRDMSWDENTEVVQLKHYFDQFYAVSQFGATALLLFADTYTLETAFSILFAIQISTFLMTLRLKGIITNNMWHICYSAALLWTYYVAWQVDNTRVLFRYVVFFYLWRVGFHQDKYIGWVVLVLFNLFIGFTVRFTDLLYII